MKLKPPASPPEVAERAYSLWEKAGRPAGQSLAHWLRAEAELAAEIGAPEKPRRQTRKAVPKKAAPKKAAPAARKTPSRPRPEA